MNPCVLNGLVITALIHGGVALGFVAFTGWGWGDSEDARPALKMVAIEAALAYKSNKPETTQPQKPPSARKPPPPVKQPGVSRDENKKVEPEPPKKVDEPPEEDFSKAFEKYRQERQSAVDDEDDGLEPQESAGGGQFDGSQHGFAEVSRGDPYMQELAGQVFAAWEVPTLERGEGTAVGCVRLAPDGSVVDTQLWKPAKNANIDRSVSLALKSLQAQRKPGEAPLPRHLLDATKQWTCFNFPVTSQ